MTVFTKQAIGQAFFELLGEMPFDKITVTDISARCGINRNTFYYHYKDIYDLLDARLDLERNAIAQAAQEDFSTWHLAIALATGFAREYSQQIYNLYNSVNRVRMERYILDVALASMMQYVSLQASDLDVNRKDIEMIAQVYALVLASIVVKWLEEGMVSDLLISLERIEYLFEGSARNALQRCLEQPDPTIHQHLEIEAQAAEGLSSNALFDHFARLQIHMPKN